MADNRIKIIEKPGVVCEVIPIDRRTRIERLLRKPENLKYVAGPRRYTSFKIVNWPHSVGVRVPIFEIEGYSLIGVMSFAMKGSVHTLLADTVLYKDRLLGVGDEPRIQTVHDL